MYCNKCKNVILEGAKFCGKCGNKFEIEEVEKPAQDISRSDKVMQELNVIEVKKVGALFHIFGYICIVFVLLSFALTYSKTTDVLTRSYPDLVIGIVVGVLYVIFGGRIKKNVDTRTRKYLLIIFWLLVINAVTNFISRIIEGHAVYTIIISIWLIIFARGGLKTLKEINVPQPQNEYLLRGWRWLWFSLASVALIGGAAFYDLSGYIKFAADPKEISIDKSSQYSEVTGNMYRNTKYNFRIKFPEGWEIKSGDGLHIVQKAVSSDGTINVLVREFDFSGELFSSINDAGSAKEFIDTVMAGVSEKFSDVKIIDYGETRIDNEPAYWVEYSAKSQVLDFNLDMTQLIYFVAKGNIMYQIDGGAPSNKYPQMKPEFYKSVSTFVIESGGITQEPATTQPTPLATVPIVNKDNTQATTPPESANLNIAAKETPAKAIPSKASGLVTTYNKQESPQRLIKNTRFQSTEGKIFRLLESVTVPANGSIEVAVVADETGVIYNIPPSTFKMPGLMSSPAYDLVYARSFVPMQGGN